MYDLLSTLPQEAATRQELSLSEHLHSIPWEQQADVRPSYPITDFEAQWLAEGRAVHKLRARTRER